MLGMSKYFQVHNYSSVMQARVAIYNLNGKEARWWCDLNHTKKDELGKLLKYFPRKIHVRKVLSPQGKRVP